MDEKARAHVTLSLVSHTNVGKTTLARTLLRRDVGEVLDQAHVTEVAEKHLLLGTEDAELLLWDTPGFGDSARLLARLRRHDQPLLWFFQQLWDRVADRPLWCSQQAALNIRDEADLVLYLVNATEDPGDAGYVVPEIELLQWIGKPLVVVLNQTGDVQPSSVLAGERLKLWRRHLQRFPIVKDVLALDAFSRCWLEEDELFARLVPLLDEDRRETLRELRTAWKERNLHIFERSILATADYLARAATDTEELSSKKPSKEEKERAMTALGQRLEEATGELNSTLLTLHGLEGAVAEDLARQLDGFTVAGEERIDPEKGAILGSVVSGALGGLAADILAGGFTFGGGVLAGAILGALGGAGLARGYQWVTAGRRPTVAWSPAFLDRLVQRTLLRYLAVAHFGRGRGEFRAGQEPRRWKDAVTAALRADADGWAMAWKGLKRIEHLSPSIELLRPWVDRTARGVLAELYPGSEAVLSVPGTDTSAPVP